MASGWHWQGVSGLWYKHSIRQFPAPLLAMPGNYIAARRAPDGTRGAIYVGETDDLDRCWRDHAASGLLARALDLGANEIHLHFTARDETERRVFRADLRRGQDAPLNRGPTPVHDASEPWSLRDPVDPDPIVELANRLNALGGSTGRQTPLPADMRPAYGRILEWARPSPLGRLEIAMSPDSDRMKSSARG